MIEYMMRCVVSLALGSLLLAAGQSEAQDGPPERLASRTQEVTRSQATALSALFPGLGQLAVGHRTRGTALVTAELTCLVIWLTSHEDYETQSAQIGIESRRYLSLREGGSFEEAEESWQRLTAKKDDLDGSHTRRRLFGALAAVVYGYNLVDVMVLGGAEPHSASSVSVVPMTGNEATGVALVARF
ncbi:MAG TPA: hypothetical protein DIC52_17995 [Candidatus Latescibacteria bacterium]|nr:hypothetical protein [Candidatus Latescibacterota bacterium]|tara:strand:- start:2562 stop:3122 length:561 start_codon:yes stop_codon:yes gene_type:complete